MNRTERALEAVSKAVREATFAFEREMVDVNVHDLPTPVIRKLSAATDALGQVLVEAEGFADAGRRAPTPAAPRLRGLRGGRRRPRYGRSCRAAASRPARTPTP